MPTKEQIKAWLASIGADRAWLGEKLGVTKRAVDNWLSSNKDIPELKLAIIRHLMNHETPARQFIAQPLVIHPTKEQFNEWNNAWRESEFPTLEDWAIQGLDQLAAELTAQNSPENTLKVADTGDRPKLESLGPVTYPKRKSRKQ